MKNFLLNKAKKFSWEIFLILVLLIGVFLGDGKQAGIDVYISSSILVVFLLWRVSGIKLVYPHKSITLAFVLPLVWSSASVFWSDGIAATVFASVRLFMGYLSFIIGSTWIKERGLPSLLKTLVLFVSLLIIISWFLIPFPRLYNSIPQMNLFYANYGHSHLADLLVLLFPVALFFSWQHKSRFWVLGSGFWVLGLISSFARAAWLLLALAALTSTIFMRRHLSHRVKLFSLLLTFYFLLLFIGITFFGSQIKPANDVSWLGRQIVKVKPLADGRLEYWRQAFTAIKERPLFGSGAGTFDLESKRLQSQPNSYTWFAHNSFLQTWVELGIIGVLAWGILAVVLVNQLRLYLASFGRNSALCQATAVGILLILIYSLFDFVLDYLLTWSLIWLVLGALLGGEPSAKPPVFVKPALVFVGVFYLTSLIFLLNVPFISNYSFYPPAGVGEAEEKIVLVNSARLRSTLFYYAHDAQILHWAGMQHKLAGQEDKAIEMYELATIWDSLNADYIKKYLIVLGETNRRSEAGRLLYRIGVQIRPILADHSLLESDLINALLYFFETEVVSGILYGIPLRNEGYAKLMYILGEEALSRDQELTKRLWTLARDTAPSWGYFHVELASLERWVFQDPKSARQILTDCLRLPAPSFQCQWELDYGISPVGSQKQKIEIIPRLD